MSEWSSNPSPMGAAAMAAFVGSRETAPAYWFNGTLWVILADTYQTGGSFSVMEQWMRAGVGPPPHIHPCDEWFFVFEGGMDMHLGTEALAARAGDSVWIPRGTDHSFRTTEDNTHVLNAYTPGGFEQVIAGLGVPAERREMPPADLALPTLDELTRLLSNYWTATTTSPWSTVAPQR